MPISKQDIIAIIAQRLFDKDRDAVTFSQIATVLQALSMEDKQRIADAVSNRNTDAVGKLIMNAVLSVGRQRAINRATQMLASDEISLADLMEWLGED